MPNHILSTCSCPKHQVPPSMLCCSATSSRRTQVTASARDGSASAKPHHSESCACVAPPHCAAAPCQHAATCACNTSLCLSQSLYRVAMHVSTVTPHPLTGNSLPLAACRLMSCTSCRPSSSSSLTRDTKDTNSRTAPRPTGTCSGVQQQGLSSQLGKRGTADTSCRSRCSAVTPHQQALSSRLGWPGHRTRQSYVAKQDAAQLWTARCLMYSMQHSCSRCLPQHMSSRCPPGHPPPRPAQGPCPGAGQPRQPRQGPPGSSPAHALLPLLTWRTAPPAQRRTTSGVATVQAAAVVVLGTARKGGNACYSANAGAWLQSSCQT